MKANYKNTLHACFVSYVVQAIINNFAPLMFLTFQRSYGISFLKITMLGTLNFSTQLVVDFLSAGFIDKIGYRAAAQIAHILSAVGLISLVILPELFTDPFIGLVAAVLIYASGGGILEVLVSPIVESCPTDNKEKAMSLLHSFYCWGHVGVVLISTLFFQLFGIENWKALAILWALIPAANTVIFMKVPIMPLLKDGEAGLTITGLLRKKVFWIMIVMMICAGASEQSIAQWASAIAENGLNVGKAAGDLAGPMLFAAMMGISRLIYGKLGEHVKLERFMIYSGFLCLFSYLIISLAPWPFLGFIGFGLCGLSVGILWPGTFSIASAGLKGGTAMFAFLALAGDLGCSIGPTLVGSISGLFDDNLKAGVLFAIVFPVILIFAVTVKIRKQL